MHRRHALPLIVAAAVAAFTAVPASADPARKPDVDIELTAAPGEAAIVPGGTTRVWRFTGRVLEGPASALQELGDSHLGPVIRLRRGQHVRIRFRNRLGEPSIIHWHGLDVPESADGHPRFAIGQEQEYVYEFDVTNRAGTYWYHPHPHMRTAAQVYQGLAGMLIVSDDEEDRLGLPAGEQEFLWVLQDRRFDEERQLVYASAAGAREGGGPGRGRGPGRGMGGGMRGMMETMNGWLGDRMLVSGKPDAAVAVDRRAYRIRLLNGSNARIYQLAWNDGTPLTLLGTDGGLLAKPCSLEALTLAPGQRADVLLDLSAWRGGGELKLVSREFPAAEVGMVGMMGNVAPVPQGRPLELVTLTISDVRGPGCPLPESLAADDFKPDPAAPVRSVPLMFMHMNWMIDGEVFDMQDVADAETVARGSTHVWEFENRPNPMGMAMAHPMHLHGRQFRVLDRSGGEGGRLRDGIHDGGWQDTVLVLPGEKVRIQVRFSDFPGLYAYHCHILEHEDMGMMRNFRIAAP